MSRLILLIPLVVALGGCSQSRETYQQTRYVPTTTTEVYSPVARMSWSGQRQVYELPTTSPAVDGDTPARMDCQRPGPQFKPTTMVAWSRASVTSVGPSETQSLVGVSLDRPDGYDTSMPAPDVVAMDTRPYKPGLEQANFKSRIGATNERPRSTTGVGTETRSVGKTVGLNDRTNPYCDHDDTYGTLRVEPSKRDE